MRTTTRFGLAATLIVGAGVAGVPPTPSVGAAPIESFIGFGFLDDGTRLLDFQPVTDQYESGDGIIFVPSVENVFCSATNAVCDAALTGDAAASAPPDSDVEFRYQSFGIQFTDVVRDSVSFGLRAMVGVSGDIPYLIRAYDSSGGLVDTTSGRIGQTWETIAITAPSIDERIAFVRVEGGDDGNTQLVIDDVRSTGDDTSPPPTDRSRPDVEMILPEGGTYYPDTLPFALPYEAMVTSVQPLDRVLLSIGFRRPGEIGVGYTTRQLCGPSPAPPCPAFEFRALGDLTFDDRGEYSIRTIARTVFGSEREDFTAVTVGDPIPIERVIALEVNQGVQGQPNIVDTDDATLQEYVSYARMIPGKHALIRVYHASTFESLAWTPPNLHIEVRDRTRPGVTTYSLAPEPYDPAPWPDPTPVIDGADRSGWPLVIGTARRSLNATANYVLPGSLIEDASEVVIGDELDANRFVVRFDERTRLGVNVVGLFDDENSIPATTLEEFEQHGIPSMEDLMPYSTVEALSYHAAHWSELPHSSNDHINDPDDPKDDETHEPGCAIASSMRLWGFGSERERSYDDLTNSWVVDAAVMAHGKSDRGLRGCAFTFLAPLRTGGTFASDLDETLTHEAGHIHGFPHATQFHGEAGGEVWPYPHGWMSAIETVDGGQVFTSFGVTVRPRDAGWRVRLMDPCTTSDLADCLGAENRGNVRHEVMSYGEHRWTSLVTWNRFYDIAANDARHDATDPDLLGPFALAAGADGDTIDATLVAGRALPDGTYALDYAIAKPVPASAMDFVDPDEVELTVRAVDAAGTVLDQRGGNLVPTDASDDGAYFMAPLHTFADVVLYELVVDGTVVATLEPSGAAPTVTEVTVTTPSDGYVRASWSIVDPGDPGHTTVLWVSYDDGITWLPGAFVQPGQTNSVRLYVADAPAGAEISVRLISTDGFSSHRVEVTGATCFGLTPTIIGNGGAIVGTDADDVIMGSPGDDSIDARQGNDIVCGGDGADQIVGGSGSDTIDGGAGNDTISGAQGNDTILGAAGNDTLFGDRGDDRLIGDAGDDTIFGGRGNDVLIGGDGDDTLDGGPGHDDVTP